LRTWNYEPVINLWLIFRATGLPYHGSINPAAVKPSS
jgi:hypothetical protein